MPDNTLISPDAALKRQFSKDENFADMFNCGLFGGKPLVKAQDLTVTNSVRETQIDTIVNGVTDVSRIGDIERTWKTSSGGNPPGASGSRESDVY